MIELMGLYISDPKESPVKASSSKNLSLDKKTQITWSEKHPQELKPTKNLQNEIDVLDCTPKALAVTGGLFKSLIVSWFLSPLFIKIENRQFDKITPEEVIKNFPSIISYLDQGKISIDNVFKLLSMKNPNGTVLHSVMGEPQIFELLERFLPSHLDLLTRLLSLRDQNGCTIFWLPISFKPLIPLLQKYIPHHIKDLISVFSIQNKDGETLLFLENMIEELHLILSDLINHDMAGFAKLIGQQNGQGLTILFFDNVMKDVHPLLEIFFPLHVEKLTRLLKLQNKDGWTVLSNPNYLSTFFPLLAQYDAQYLDQLVEVLSVQNGFGQTILHYHLAFEQIFPFLAKTFATHPKFLLKILSIKNVEGDTCLKNSLNLDKCKDELARLFFDFPEEFIKLLSAQNIHGETLLHDPLLFQKFHGYFYSYDDEQFTSIMSIQNQFGDTPLHTLSNFQKVSDRVKGMTHLLKIENKAGLSVEEASKYKLNDSWLSSIKYHQTNHSLQHDDSVKTHQSLKGFAISALKSLIEKMVVDHFTGDSHVKNQLYYAAGLAPTFDGLSNMTVEKARQQIHFHWSLPSFYREGVSSDVVEKVDYLDPHLKTPLFKYLHMLNTLGCLDA